MGIGDAKDRTAVLIARFSRLLTDIQPSNHKSGERSETGSEPSEISR